MASSVVPAAILAIVNSKLFNRIVLVFKTYSFGGISLIGSFLLHKILYG